ncbi:MAG: hypothetical protein JRF72_17170 [Deltaproteobacteria bacterium]|jgi:hypothetical protein|nr:hypothetical protein [Deltaproteobacteria bacterium]
MKSSGYIFIGLILLLPALPAGAELPTVLTDTIKSGDGVIDIFKDVTGAELQQQLQSGTLYLGVDLNEDASGNESSTSAGVAIKEMELVIQTTNGDISFTEFYTNTTAMIQEAGATEAQEYNTLFGSAGSSDITGSTSNFDISNFDDVIVFENIQIDGEIIGAELRVTFLDTAGTGENETFFDYSAGFEEFAILTSTDAAAIESADIGLADAPQNVSYTVDAPSGTPEPAWFLLAAMPLLFLWRKYDRGKTRI